MKCPKDIVGIIVRIKYRDHTRRKTNKQYRGLYKEETNHKYEFLRLKCIGGYGYFNFRTIYEGTYRSILHDDKIYKIKGYKMVPTKYKILKKY